MRSHRERPPSPPCLAARAGWCAAALLTACGGEPAPPGTGALPAAAISAVARPAAAAPGLAADAPAGDAEAVPADPSIRTRHSLYLRLASAEVAEARLRGDVVWVPVDCRTGDDSDTAMLIAHGMQAARNLGNEVPFFVTGADLQVAGMVADRLRSISSARDLPPAVPKAVIASRIR